ncbi:Transcription factor 1 [Hyphodiscus hymeniophilus]|uniref:Transcription factor 1 n=1 Tax=Hyphodiscus hymeniophilus TaxID=353542 RepID=A0A9P7AVI9_9HELO|nr:Transcription factor 1 [Hyphodiscus hymeniophilus]
MEEQNGDGPMGEGTPLPTEDDSSGSGSGSDSDEEEIEWMVTAREKRSTAGNRLTSLIQQEEPDDDLELLFAEDDDDAGFEDAEADQSDVQMDSSDDDDDQGPAAGADDFDGEKELQRQAKAEKAKKRKNDGIPIFKKKVKIDPTASEAPAPRPKKKSERASWIPTAEELPTRASQRGTTKQQKKALHAQMVDREYKRLKQLANMEKAAAAKEAAKKPAMTQEDRLREAARVEKANSKSLSRWEQAEQEREEEQRAKLAALSNRHLEGPVITWWSGLAQWAGGRLKQVGKSLMIEDPKEKPATKKRKLAEMEAESEATPVDALKSGEDAPQSIAGQHESSDQPMEAPPSLLETGLAERPKTSDHASSPSGITQPESVPAKPKPEVEAMQSQLPPPQSTLLPPSGPLQPPPSQGYLQPPPQPLPILAPPPSHPPFILAPPQPWQPNLLPPHSRTALDGSVPVPGLGYALPNTQIPHTMTHQLNPFAYNTPAPPVQPDVPPPPAHETTSRNLLILANFDDLQVKNKDVQTQILFGRKFLKASSTSPFSFQFKQD